MQKGLVVLIGCLATSAFAEREMERVINISAEQTQRLLDDGLEAVLFVSSEHANKLLGDDGNVVDSISIDQINNMPATAAGKLDILYISPDAAESILGDHPY
jgi:hypothetical protein